MASDNRTQLLDFLNQQYIFESLTLPEIQTLVDFTEEVLYPKNGIIADIGEVGEAIYVVIRGETALTYESDGKSIEIGYAHPGELIGEMSFFDREPRSVRLMAKQDDTQLLRLTRVMYQRLRVEHPFIAVNLLEHAIISLDRLFRQVSQDVASYAHYIFATKEGEEPPPIGKPVQV